MISIIKMSLYTPNRMVMTKTSDTLKYNRPTYTKHDQKMKYVPYLTLVITIYDYRFIQRYGYLHIYQKQFAVCLRICFVFTR